MLGSSNDVVYSPLEQNPDVECGIELESKNSTTTNNDNITIKVLIKETTIEISNISKNDTIKQLKERIHTDTQILPHLQRLIYGGKPLKPDDKSLAFFKIDDNSSIHLFPIPIATATSTTISTESSPYTISSSSSSIDQYNQNTINSSLLFDPYVQQTCRQVKLWSIILLLLSYMALFNNTSYILSTGNFGNGFIDSFVTLLDTLCSIGGIYVGQLGLLTTRNLELQIAKKYVRYLILLAMVCIAMRVLWVLDVVSQIQQVVKKSAALHNNNNTPDVNPIESTDDYHTPELGENVIERFAIQASIIAFIIIASWVNCVLGGIRLQTLLQTYEESMSPTPTTAV